MAQMFHLGPIESNFMLNKTLIPIFIHPGHLNHPVSMGELFSKKFRVLLQSLLYFS
jgi:hypothetical protein